MEPLTFNTDSRLKKFPSHIFSEKFMRKTSFNFYLSHIDSSFSVNSSIKKNVSITVFKVLRQ